MKTKSHDTNLLIHYRVPVVDFAFDLTLQGRRRPSRFYHLYRTSEARRRFLDRQST